MAKEPCMYAVTQRPKKGNREGLKFRVAFCVATSASDAIRKTLAWKDGYEKPVAHTVDAGWEITL